MARVKAQIGRGAQRAMLVLGLILFLGLLLILGKCVMSTGSDRILAASGHDYGEIAQLGDETMLLETGSTGSEIHRWSTTGKGVHTFRVDDAMFQPGAAAITPDGGVRIDKFVKLMDSNPGLRATIFISSSPGADDEQLSLLQARARQIRKELISDGAFAQLETEPQQLPNAQEAAVYISLSKKG